MYLPLESLGLFMKNKTKGKTYATNTTTTGFGGAYYNRCTGSYLSSYHSPATSLLLNFIREFYLIYLTEQLPSNGAKNVVCYNDLNNPLNI